MSKVTDPNQAFRANQGTWGYDRALADFINRYLFLCLECKTFFDSREDMLDKNRNLCLICGLPGDDTKHDELEGRVDQVFGDPADDEITREQEERE